MAAKNTKKTGGGRPFRKGESGNPAGRPKGAKNKATDEVKSLCRSILDDPRYVRLLRKELLARTLDTKIEVLLWHYAYGKPAQALELKGTFDHLHYLANDTPDDDN